LKNLQNLITHIKCRSMRKSKFNNWRWSFNPNINYYFWLGALWVNFSKPKNRNREKMEYQKINRLLKISLFVKSFKSGWCQFLFSKKENEYWNFFQVSFWNIS
jgi:hypothetical protein